MMRSITPRRRSVRANRLHEEALLRIEAARQVDHRMPVAVCVCCGAFGDWDDTDEGYSPCCNKRCEGDLVTTAKWNSSNWNL